MIPAILLLVTLACDPAPTMLDYGLEVRGSGRLAEATNALSSARACHPEDRGIQLELAMTLAWQQRFEESLALFSLRLEAEPEDREARLGLARVLAWSRRETEAVVHYEILLAIDPDDVPALNGLAFASRVDWRLEPARKAYERVLSLEPENPEALEGLRQLDGMKRLTADVQLGGLMVSDGQRVIGNRASIAYRLRPKTSISANLSTSSRLGGANGATEKAAGLTLVRQIGGEATAQFGYRVRVLNGGPDHQVSASLSRRLSDRWTASAYARTNATQPLAEVLTRVGLSRQFGAGGYGLIQYYRLTTSQGPDSHSLVLGSKVDMRSITITPGVTAWRQGAMRSVDYSVGLSLPVKSARIGLQVGGSLDSPSPRIGYVITIR